MSHSRVILISLALLVVLAVPLTASAATTDFRILLNVDNDVATGCTVSAMPGVDQVFTTRVTTTADTAVVSQTFRQTCSGGSLGAQIPVDATGWPAGFQSSSGQLLVETRIPFSAFPDPTMAHNMRVGLVAVQGSAVHTALTRPNGDAVYFPVPMSRRRAVSAPGAPRVIVLDGLDPDWTGLKALFEGIGSGGVTGLRMEKFYGFADTNRDIFFFRFNVNLSTSAPFAQDDFYTRAPGSGLTVPGVDGPTVLDNDTDPNGLPLTATLVSQPPAGDVVLNQTGGFTYTPDNPASTAPDTFEYKANNGDRDSNVAKVTISVEQAGTPNQAPSFTKGTDRELVEDAGNQAVVNWAKNISAGPGEASQTVTFVVTNNTNPNLFDDPPAIDATGTLTFTPAADANGQATITIKLVDNGGTANGGVDQSAPQTFYISVEGINDAPSYVKGTDRVVLDTAGAQSAPNWASSRIAGPADETGQALNFIVTNNNSALFSVAPSIAPDGTLTFTPAPGQSGIAVVTARIHDNGGTANGGFDTSAPQTFNVTVEKIPSITSANAVTFVAGQAGSFLVTTDGLPQPSIAIGGVALPAGLTFVDGTGVNKGTATLSGTPGALTGGVYNITFQATNPHGSSPVQNFTLTINQPPSITSANTATFTRNSAGSFTVTTVGFPAPAISLLGSLPAGLTFVDNNNGTATISGTPTNPGGSFTGFTLTASNGVGSNAVQSLTVIVNDAPGITSANSTGFAATVPATFTVTTTGFPIPSLSEGGALPAGITFVDNGNGTATLGGTATQGSGGVYTITITATNVAGSTPQTFTITVCNQIAVTNPVIASGTVGTPFSQNFTQTGAVLTATFTTASTLPPGLTLATNGTLSGTPTLSGTYQIVVTVTDANGCTGTGATYTLVINCQTITVTPPVNGNGTASSPFSETFTEVGAIGGATFTLNSGTLPAGLTLSAAGVVSGTPTQTGSFPITVKVTDGNGCTGVSPIYPIVIACQTITVNNPVNANGTAASAFSEVFTQSGAIGTATFTLNSGTLPAGLTLAANGTLSGTPTQTGSFPITVKVTDGNGCTGISPIYPLFIACQVITVTNPVNAGGTVSAPFSETFTQFGAIGGATFTTASTLPAGLTLSPAGVLSGTPTQSGSFPIVVTVTDSNGCTGNGGTYPLVIACQTITVTNPVNAGGTVSAPFSETFTQASAVGGATFTLNTGVLPAGLTLSAAGVLSGTPTQSGSFPITVKVTDGNGCTGISPIYPITIACQTITVTNPATNTGTAGSPFSQTFTQTGAILPATFTLNSGTLPAGLTLATNGTLSGTPTETGTFNITVKVTDANGCTGVGATYTLTIGCQTITVTNPGVTTGTVNVPFSQTFTQTGAIGGATFTLNTGTLPAGLTLSAAGVLSGTPTQTGTFNITVKVTDGNSCTGISGTYTLVIGCQTITVTNPATNTGTAGSPFSQTFTQTNAILPVTFSTASTLPAGLTLSAAGVLSGTPTQTGPFSIVVTVTDANGCTGVGSTYNLTIGCQTITVTSPGVTTGTVSAPFSQTFTQTGGLLPVTFTINTGTLPAGLTLATNGTLSGTPTQTGSFPITVKVTDVNGCTGFSATYTLVIGCQTITVTNPANAAGTVSAPFNETFTQSGGILPVTFTLDTGVLPAGLTLSAAGVVSGTPTQTGSFPITVKVTDSNNCTGFSATYTITIACQTITVTNPANATGPAGSPFSETFTQTGAILPATFTLNTGVLPAGLTLAANGVLSGTPSEGGSFPITVKVTDSNNCTGISATYALVITCPVVTVTNPATATGTAGTAFSQTFTQSGGQGTITFTLNSGTLPTGLTLATNGTLSGTPTQTGSFPITVKATDQNGCSGVGATYTLVISCQTITVTNPATTTGTAGSPFSQTFTQTGAIGGVTFTLNSGTLPAGLTLSAAGVLSGTPTQTGSFPITVKVTDGNLCTGISTPTYTLVIGCQTITVTNPATTTATVNAAFSQNFTQTGAIGGATFTLNSGSLPTGFTLATNGTLSGTTQQNGSFPITVKVTDGNNCTGISATYTLVIACQTITVTNPANAAGTVGSAFNETFTQVGALAGSTFTLNTGVLPAGLTLSAAGVLAGTPTQAGSFPITVKVTDGNGCTGISATYTITLACQTITVNNPGTTTGTVDAPFSQSFTNTGAIGSVTYTINSGTLPSGLTLSAAGVLSGTPGQPGTFNITVKVTDANLCTGISATYTLIIACQTITVTNPVTATGTVDAAFSQTFTQVGVGTHTPANFTTSSTLPSGLTLSSAGVLSGTPGQPGTFPITVTVTDANGCTGVSSTYTLIIACQTITVTNPGVTTATYNSAFTRNFTQVGVGTHTPANFTTSSTLPTGVTLATNGTLAGTPTQTGTFPIVVTVTDANGCTGTGATYTLAVAPVANNDSFNGGVDNTQLVLTGGTTGTPTTPSVQIAGTIKVNDLPSAATVAVVPATVATSGGGSVTIAADGTFLYTPKANPALAAITSDTFTYTVTSNTGGVAAVTSAPGTVTINLVGRVWYVKNNAAGGGNGQSQAPFNTLASAGTASTANDFIFVYKGDGATTNQNSGFVLKNGQQFIGEGVTLTVNGSNLVTGAPANQPQIGNSAGNGVTGANISGVVIRGLNIGGSADAINFTTNAANSGNVTIADNTIRAAGTQGINIDGGGSGALTISLHDNILTSTGNAIDIARTAGTVTITAFDDNTVTGNSAASGIVVTGTGAAVLFDSVVGGGVDTVLGGATNIGASGNGVGGAGMVLNGVAGDLHFSNLNVYADNGAGVSVTGNGGMQFRVNTGGGNTGTIIAVNGPAVDANTAALDLRLVSMSSTNSTTTGVNLATVTGTFTAASGSTISNATGTDFNINAGTATVTYDGTITDTTGRVVAVANTTAGTKTFTGAITNNGATGTGISLTSNTGAIINFTGVVALTTSGNPAFTATGGGTISATNTSNTLSTTTATALNVDNTSIGAGGLKFQSVNVNGNDVNPASGIILNNTGAAGGLSVLSTGAGLTGGTIQNTSSHGISLTSTAKVSLTRMNLTSNLGSGIFGAGVNGFVVANSSITANGDTAASDESGINIGELTGTAAAGANPTSITNTTISNNFEFELQITNTTGTLTDLQMSGNTISANGLQLNHGNLFNFLALGTANMTLNVTGGTFTGNTDISGGKIVTATGLQCDHSGTGGTVTCNVSNAFFTNNNVGPQASVAGGGQMVFNFSNNNVQGSRSHGINVFADANPPFTKSINGRIQNNIVGTAGVTGSASTVGFPIRVQNEGRIPVTLSITGNTISESVGFTGINVNHGISTTAGTATTSVTITGNNVSNVDSGRGVLVQQVDHSTAGLNAGTVCADIGANVFSSIAGQAGDGTIIRVRESSNAASGPLNVRQLNPTGAANPLELDDANGITLAQTSISGAPVFNAGACAQPSN